MSDASTPRPEHLDLSAFGGEPAPAAPVPPTAPGPNGVQLVLPYKVPLAMVVQVTELGAEREVILQVFGPTGCAVYHLSHEDARQWSVQLAEAARVARTGLVVGRGQLNGQG